MVDPLHRFSSRVENYLKYRPGYPSEVLDLLREQCGLERKSVIADVGSGTGILSRLFLENGNRLFGIEPNDAMRAAGERQLRNYERFLSVKATAEDTTLEPNSIDFVTAGQAFHWFDQARARKEFIRILKPDGWVVLIWNERLLHSTPFLRAYEELLLQYGTDYQTVRHEKVTASIQDFFTPGRSREAHFKNEQSFDFEGLIGRVASSSYAPEQDHPMFKSMSVALRKVFNEHAENGRVAFEYTTSVYYGHLC